MINLRIYDFLSINLTSELCPLTRVLPRESQNRVHLKNRQLREAICQTCFDIEKQASWPRFSIFEFPIPAAESIKIRGQVPHLNREFQLVIS